MSVYSIVIFVALFSLASVSAVSRGDCVKLAFGKMHCCTLHSPREQQILEDVKECFKPGMNPASCESDICAALKKGYASSDGTLNKAVFTEGIENEFGNDSDLVQAITDHCINGDISEFGKPDACDLMKLRHCVHIEVAVRCPAWDDNGSCKGMKDLAEECKTLIA